MRYAVRFSSEVAPLRLRTPLRSVAFCMVFVMLIVRLGTFSEELFVTPVEDAIFDVAVVETGNQNPQTRPLAVKHKGFLDCDLPRFVIAVRAPLPATPLVSFRLPLLSPLDVAFEIFIPPEVFC